jgi:hypothetical protein
MGASRGRTRNTRVTVCGCKQPTKIAPLKATVLMVLLGWLLRISQHLHSSGIVCTCYS